MDCLYNDIVPNMPKLLHCSACGREFLHSNAYSVHVGSCQPQKKRIASSLELAKEMYKRRKTINSNAPAQIQLSQPEPPENAPISTIVVCAEFSLPI